MCANHTLSATDLPPEVQALLAQIQGMLSCIPKEGQDEILAKVVDRCRSVGMPESSIQIALRIVREGQAEAAPAVAVVEDGHERVEVGIYTVVIDGREMQVVPLETFEKVSNIAHELGDKLEEAVEAVQQRNAHITDLVKSLERILGAGERSSDAAFATKATMLHAVFRAKLPNLFK